MLFTQTHLKRWQGVINPDPVELDDMDATGLSYWCAMRRRAWAILPSVQSQLAIQVGKRVPGGASGTAKHPGNALGEDSAAAVRASLVLSFFLRHITCSCRPLVATRKDSLEPLPAACREQSILRDTLNYLSATVALKGALSDIDARASADDPPSGSSPSA